MHASQWPGSAHAVNITTNEKKKEKDKTLLQHAPFPAQSELAQPRCPRPPRIAKTTPRPECPSPTHCPCIKKRKSRDINRLLRFEVTKNALPAHRMLGHTDASGAEGVHGRQIFQVFNGRVCAGALLRHFGRPQTAPRANEVRCASG